MASKKLPTAPASLLQFIDPLYSQTIDENVSDYESDEKNDKNIFCGICTQEMENGIKCHSCFKSLHVECCKQIGFTPPPLKLTKKSNKNSYNKWVCPFCSLRNSDTVIEHLLFFFLRFFLFWFCFVKYSKAHFFLSTNFLFLFTLCEIKWTIQKCAQQHQKTTKLNVRHHSQPNCCV